MGKLKSLCKKYKEILLYLIFGFCTTGVGWVVYFALLWTWKAIFSLPASDTTSAEYLLGYTIAQIVQWVVAVLFAFFTNRKWVFTNASRDVKTSVQLAKFAGGRLLTFGIDYVVTLFAAIGIAALIPSLCHVPVFGMDLNFAEIAAKLLAAVIVIACNYIFSKLFVFQTKKK